MGNYFYGATLSVITVIIDVIEVEQQNSPSLSVQMVFDPDLCHRLPLFALLFCSWKWEIARFTPLFGRSLPLLCFVADSDAWCVILNFSSSSAMGVSLRFCSSPSTCFLDLCHRLPLFASIFCSWKWEIAGFTPLFGRSLPLLCFVADSDAWCVILNFSSSLVMSVRYKEKETTVGTGERVKANKMNLPQPLINSHNTTLAREEHERSEVSHNTDGELQSKTTKEKIPTHLPPSHRKRAEKWQ
ncbi:uncharacterized protein LOC129289130 [Prosopis cineraria]|uniref:uncharacterized protein LOC129289130 n=1 Tax=Prosopis cineraria TaxID=364024 RepID=UPI00240F0DB4|nr:uncharacterized protein LOC129289130 [Prosopis cineraria]